MNLHSLRNTKGAKHRKMRVGRGRASGKGKTSGRGHKGQMSRSGSGHKPGFEGGQMPLIRRLPKRGFTHLKKRTLVPVNISKLSRFDDGIIIDLDVLKNAGLATGPIDGVKILGMGDLSKKLIVKAQAFSTSARTKIEAAGGQCEVVS